SRRAAGQSDRPDRPAGLHLPAQRRACTRRLPILLHRVLRRRFRAVAVLTGQVLADGTRTEGIGLDDAERMVAVRDADPAERGVLYERFAYGSNVGCNMAYRYSAMHDIVFDERLPLYAWHEDSDFRGQVERRGLFARAED